MRAYGTLVPQSVGVRYAYNLIEIMLATVVVVVGVVGVMSLVPISQNANRDAFGQGNSADAGDQFIRILASKMKINWELSTALPMSRPLADESTVAFSFQDSGGILHEVPGIQIAYDDTDGDGRLDYAEGDRDDSGIFKIVQQTDGNLDDFTAVVRVWRQAASYRYYDARSGLWARKAVDPSAGVELNLELSFPAELPYEARSKRQLSLNVFRPKENPAQGYIFAGLLADSLNVNLPPQLDAEGYLNLSPNNSGNLREFYMQTPTGVITRDTLKGWHDINYKGPNNSFVYYDGKALAVFFQPKGNGNDNDITLIGDTEMHGFDTAAIEILNGTAYHVTSENMTVTLFQGKNAGPGGNTVKNGGKPNMGHWWIQLVAHDAVISVIR